MRLIEVKQVLLEPDKIDGSKIRAARGPDRLAHFLKLLCVGCPLHRIVNIEQISFIAVEGRWFAEIVETGPCK